MNTIEVSTATTGSFQNHTTISTSKRSRGMVSLLKDVTNLEPQAKRSCSLKASLDIKKQTQRLAPRGNPSAGGCTRAQNLQLLGNEEDSDCQVAETLQQVLKHDRPTFERGTQWISTFVERNTTAELNKAFTLKIFSTAVSTWGCNITTASQRAAEVTGVSTYTIQKWAAEYYVSLVGIPPDDIDLDLTSTLLSSERGRSCKNPHSIIHDEQFCISAREFVRSRAYQKGAPNMTVKDFRDWIQNKFNVNVCLDTARVYLHSLGFSLRNHHKAVYFDGHERDDVVDDRKQFVETIEKLNRRMLYPGHAPQLEPGEKRLIQIHHDESTFYSNADQSTHWDDGTLSVLKQKSLGQSIMVSDFIDEASSDYLHHNSTNTRLLLETSTDGYFDNKMLLKQVDNAMDVFEAKYPNDQGLFIFDNAPSHKKYAEDALNAEKMNVRPGGKQPSLRDTIFNGHTQTMVLPDGTPKGMKLVLEERGIDTTDMNAKRMREVLKQQGDFKNVKTLLEERVEGRGHICLFFPKFHCELNAIERCWCQAKKHTRAYSNGTITRLRKSVPEGLESCTSDMIAKFFVTCRDYMRAYREGKTCENVDRAVKQYKSHRRVFDSNNTI